MSSKSLCCLLAAVLLASQCAPAVAGEAVGQGQMPGRGDHPLGPRQVSALSLSVSLSLRARSELRVRSALSGPVSCAASLPPPRPACTATVTVTWNNASGPKVSKGKYAASQYGGTLSACVGDTVAFSWGASSGPCSSRGGCVYNLIEGDAQYFSSCKGKGKTLKQLVKTSSSGYYSVKVTAAGTRYFGSNNEYDCSLGASGGRCGLGVLACGGPASARSARLPADWPAAALALGPGYTVKVVAKNCSGR